jgi:CelD/BcsL family acetyltransferase involved in cellulose biosynthesis
VSRPSAQDQLARPALAVERVPPERWASIADWDDAVAAAARPSVYLTHDWVSAWWASFQKGLEPLLLRVSDAEGTTVGLAPLYLERPRRLPVRRLGILGDKLVGSEYLGLVARAGREAEVARATIGYLAEAGIRWDLAELIGLPEDDPAAAALEAALAAGAAQTRGRRDPCVMAPLPDNFDDYLATLGYQFRQTYRRRHRKLEATFPVRYITTDDEADLPAHLDRLFEMHQAHWTASGYSGSFFDPRMRGFYLEVSKRLLRAGRLRFWHLEVDGVIRACQYGYVYDGVEHSLQEGYDIGFKAPGIGSLGVVLRAQALRSAIEDDHLRGYDFLGGDQDFKTRWQTETRWIRTVQIAAPGPRGRLAWLATVSVADARAWFVRVTPDRLVAAGRVARARLRGS